MNPATTGALLGLVGGSALVYAIGRTPLMRRNDLADRIAPYLRESAGSFGAPASTSSNAGPLGALLHPLLHDANGRAVGGCFRGGHEADASQAIILLWLSKAGRAGTNTRLFTTGRMPGPSAGAMSPQTVRTITLRADGSDRATPNVGAGRALTSG